MSVNRPVSPVLLLVLTLASAAPTGETRAQSASVHLALGNPSGAVTDAGQPHNYLIDRPQYALLGQASRL